MKANQFKKISELTKVAFTIGSILYCSSASAAISSNSNLSMTLGSGAPGLVAPASGSYFAMEALGPGGWFYVPIEGNDGINIASSGQPASGSHSGAPDGSETPGIDLPWSFFANTGMHQSNAGITIVSDNGSGNVVLEFSGWGVTWNAIPNIDMGGGIQDCGTDSDGVCVDVGGTDIAGVYDNGTGQATVTCATDCSTGDPYVLDYNAVVPQADPSNFGGVSYQVHLEGTITDNNQSPVAADASASLAVSTSVLIDLTGNVTDSDGTVDFTTFATTYAGSATITDNDDGTVTYQDNDGVAASDSFTFTFQDNDGAVSNTATVNVTVAVGNVPPTANNFTVVTVQDAPIDVDVVANTSDSDGTVDPTTVAASNPVNGTITSINGSTGVVTFTPNAGFYGTASFDYTVDDDQGDTSNTATVTVTVNSPPTAGNGTATVDRNSSVSVDVVSLTSDIDGTTDPTTVNASQGTNGTTVVDAVTGAVTYTPTPGYVGGDSFTYTIDDDLGATSNQGAIVVTVNNVSPIAQDDSALIDVAADISVDIDVTANDSDPDGSINVASVVIGTTPSNGTTSVAPVTGVVTYTPTGIPPYQDSFTYTVLDNDNAVSNVATVTISVNDSSAGVLDPRAFLIMVTGNVTDALIRPPLGQGSWFSMEVQPGSPLHTAIAGFNHLQLGVLQPASSVPLLPDIDNGWIFFGNIGVHQTTVAVTILTDDGAGNVTLGLSGWDVSWNAIPSIPLGSGPDNGVGTLTCYTNLALLAQGTCAAGDEFVLDYSATVPPGDPSGFGGVPYSLHMEGVISLTGSSIGGGDPSAPYDVDVAAAVDANGAPLTIDAGTTAASVGNTTGFGLTSSDIGVNDPLMNPSNGAQCIGGCADFVVTNVTTDYIDIVFKLNVPNPSDGTQLRKLKNNQWGDFDASGGDLIGSASSDANGNCQGPAGVFQVGLREGLDCVYLRISDGGSNDADELKDGKVEDPSGVLLAGDPNVPPGSTSGCSITSQQVSLKDRADWLILAGFLFLLLVYRHRQARD